MSLTGGVVVFVLLWWLVLFMVLPWGVRTQDEAGETVQGAADSAPERPLLWRKAAITTAVAALLWSAIYLALASGWIRIEDLPVYGWSGDRD